MAKLIFENSGDEELLDDGEKIAEVCEQAGIPFACTEGVCGTCVVEIVEGNDHLSPPTQEEEDFLGSCCARERLACQCRILHGEVKIRY